MADQLQLRGGTTAEHAGFTGALREVTVDIDKDTLVVHDAVTAGGRPLLREDGSNSALALGSAATPSLKWDSGTGIYSPGADQVAVATNGVKRIEIQADGDIDIDGGGVFYDATNNRLGIGTTSPGELLSVNGNVSILSTRRIKTTDSGGNLTIQGGGAFPGGHIILNGGSGSDNIIFNRSGASASTVETARIDSSGRLLVGTSTAVGSSNAVVIKGTSGVSNASIYLGNTGNASTLAAGNTLGFIEYGSADGGVGAQVLAVADETWSSTSDCPTRLLFSTTADGASSPTTHLAIRATGNIHYKSSVINANGVGNSPSAEGIEMGGGFIGQQFPSTSTNGTYFNIFFRGTSIIGSITQNGTTQVSYNTSSDYRLKENIEEISGALIYLKNLKPCKFNFISEPDRTIHGFLAHEVQTIVPEAITGEKDEVDEDGNPQYQGIDQSKLVPLLTAALQETIAKIETLEGMVAVNNITIDEQQHQLSTLEARLTALESA